MTPDEVGEALAQRKANVLVGQLETEQVEFKFSPYRLNEERQKRELAKDVSALANGSGGIIVLGMRTERDEHHPSDRAVEVRPFPVADLDVRQYLDVVQQWVYPPPDGVLVLLFPEASAEGRGLAAVIVPRQSDSTGPFVVWRDVDENGREEGAFIGCFVRRGAHSRPLTHSEIQGTLRDGRLFQRSLDERARGIPAGPSQTEAPRNNRAEPGLPELTHGRAVSLTEEAGLDTGPAYTLTATPYPHVDASRMFTSEYDALTLLLRDPPILRPRGFDLRTGVHPNMYAGQLRRSIIRGYKGLAYWRDGTLIFVVTAGDDFLSWGDRDEGDPHRISPVPLLECALLYCLLASRISELVAPRPARVAYSLHLRRMCVGSKTPILRPGRDDPQRLARSVPAPGCETDGAYQASSEVQAASVAFHLTRELYRWFGLTDDQMPHATGGLVDADAFVKMQ